MTRRLKEGAHVIVFEYSNHNRVKDIYTSYGHTSNQNTDENLWNISATKIPGSFSTL